MGYGIFPEWLNVNSGRAFPLAENASRMDSTGSVRLPDSLIVAAQINQTASYAAGTFFVSRLIAVPDLVSVTISFFDGEEAPRAIATISVPVELHRTNKTYAFVGEGVDEVILGSLTIGALDETLRTVPGQLSFDVSATPFEVSALFVSTPSLEAVEIYNGTTLLRRHTRVLKLRAGENIRLSYVDGDPDVIRIDAISGENLINPDTCENAVPVPAPIRTINGVPGDSNNNFNLDGSNCLNVDVAPGVITVTDLCSKSCCGCEELEELVAGLQQVEQQLLGLRQQITDTVGLQATMVATLASNIR